MSLCAQCSTPLKPDDRVGLCPACLLAGAMGTGFPPGDTPTPAESPHSPEPPNQDRFGPYRILAVLGEGGMGTVYLAEQIEPIRRRAALKVVKLGMDTNQVLARFNHERQALALMEHTNIARILDAGASSRGRPFFVMDYIEGEAITTYCDRHQLTIADRLELFIPVCRAIQHANSKGIVHRDIKPSNVLVSVEDGKPVPKVIDFGIARAVETADAGNTFCTQFGQMVGTPEYASPEQADVVAGEISAATDVYSLGVLLYEMLAGAVPFDRALLRKAGYAEMLRILREEEAPSLKERLNSLAADVDGIAARRGIDAPRLRKMLSGGVNCIVKKALEKSPERRYASAADLAGDIERYLRREPILAAPPRRGRSIGRAAVAAAAVLALIPIAWLINRMPHRNAPPQITSRIVLSDLVNDTGDASFDDTFRQSISSVLQRSTGATLLPDGLVRDAMSKMRKPPDARITPAIAREVCQRTGSAAFLEGSFSNAGSGYWLSIRARNCADDTPIDEEQSRVAGKNDLLNELRRLAVQLESRSAASFAALQRAATPLDEVTTSSLEALKSFHTARRRAYVSPADSLVLFKRAIELDPEFATGYAWLARSYSDTGEQKMAMENIRQAYRLRGIVSDTENFFITYNYDREVLRNLELARQVCESWIEKYPRDVMPHAFLSGLTSKGIGRYDKAIEEGEKAVAMDRDFTVGYINIAEAYLYLDRPDEAKATMDRAAQRKLPVKDHYALLFFAGFLNRDRNAMDGAGAQMAAGAPYGDFEHYQSLVAAYEGRLQQSRQASIQAVTLARQAHLAERAGLFEGAAAVREALYGYPEESLRYSLAAQQLVTGRDVDFPAAFALALSRKTSAATAILKRLETEYPEDTCVRFHYSPAIRALLAINQGHTEKALDILTVSKAYELAQTGVSLYVHYGALYPTYVRGLAYERLHRYREAAAEFQRMLDHPGLLLADPVGPVVRLELARCLRDAGDTAKAKGIYRDLLALWKDADADIPLLRQARAESARL